MSDIDARGVGAVIETYARRLRKEGRSAGTNANKLLAVTKRLYRTAKGWGLIAHANPDAASEGSSSQKYVFSADPGASRAPHLYPESLSRPFARICNRLKIDNVVLHDLRRTCLLGYGALAERVAGHAGRSVLARHCDRSNRLEAMRDALTEWGKWSSNGTELYITR